MGGLSSEKRQEIIRDYAARHGGRWDAPGFLEEVRTSNGAHPAYGWFTWDRDAAAASWQLEEARRFGQGLRVKFSVEEVGGGKVSVQVKQAPMVLSPMAGRRDGGGYFVTDPTNPDHMAELCRQGANSLRQFVRRYGAALEHAGLDPADLGRMAETLDAHAAKPDAA